MLFFRVDGADLSTGEDTYMVLEASSEPEAEDFARTQGMLIASVRRAVAEDWGDTQLPTAIDAAVAAASLTGLPENQLVTNEHRSEVDNEGVYSDISHASGLLEQAFTPQQAHADISRETEDFAIETPVPEPRHRPVEAPVTPAPKAPPVAASPFAALTASKKSTESRTKPPVPRRPSRSVPEAPAPVQTEPVAAAPAVVEEEPIAAPVETATDEALLAAPVAAAVSHIPAPAKTVPQPRQGSGIGTVVAMTLLPLGMVFSLGGAGLLVWSLLRTDSGETDIQRLDFHVQTLTQSMLGGFGLTAGLLLLTLGAVLYVSRSSRGHQ